MWREHVSAQQQEAIDARYGSFAVYPYISPERDLAAWLDEVELSSAKAVPRWAMEVLDSSHGFDLTAGHVILLWRVGFDTFHTDSWYPKYFEYTYGIDGPRALQQLNDAGLVLIESAADSLDLVTGPAIKKALKVAGVSGFSALKKDELQRWAVERLSSEQLEELVSNRSLKLSETGRALLDANQSTVAKHP
ncbi:MAG: hypothetical protein Q4P78_06420 [Rothia sp. (in: high G+C Gram-positive bacteria)]|uniref:hypothetical protein n=1 Tax=Rothia sp. (in: high G+C Gram-positive bacteria) TaxID=1885016 RepID=UPI0026DECF1D|nr:hypothetical protein [Rothia sp. (in: high G+C Gram-positive bacteria)]MDO5750824.1 hypothetical protein [Rothia sp. (in: high G+C Gram-positive bacteria)]